MSKKTAKKNVLVEEDKTEKFLTKIFGDPQKKILKELDKEVVKINELAAKYEKMGVNNRAAFVQKLFTDGKPRENAHTM